MLRPLISPAPVEHVLAWPFRSLWAVPGRCLGAGSWADGGFQPLWSVSPPFSAPQHWGWGQLLRGVGSTRRTLATGDNKSTDYEGQLNCPSSARRGLSPLLIKALCTRRELSVGPFSMEWGRLWDLPGSPSGPGCGAAPSSWPRCCRWTLNKPGAGGIGFLPARRRALRQSREEDPRGK